MILLVLGLVPARVWAQSSNFTLNAKIGTESLPAKAYLVYNISDKRIVDSALVNNGVFQFKGTVDGPVPAEIMLDHH